MRVTSLIENSKSPESPQLQAEFGLSLLIEHRDTTILLDTGTTGAFTRNALQLCVDPNSVDLAVLSHHHFDHGGGLAAFFEQNSHADVYLKRPPEGAPYARAFGVVSRYIGIDASLLESQAERFVFVDRFSEIAPEVFLFPDIVKDHPRPEGNRRLYLRTQRGWEHDAFDHELILAVRDADGIVVFTGCSHAGILNMIQTVVERFPGVPVKGVIGGFHLMGMPPFGTGGPSKRSIAALGREMLAYAEAKYYTGHCTGQRAFRVLKSVMAERIEPIITGTVLTL